MILAESCVFQNLSTIQKVIKNQLRHFKKQMKTAEVAGATQTMQRRLVQALDFLTKIFVTGLGLLMENSNVHGTK